MRVLFSHARSVPFLFPRNPVLPPAMASAAPPKKPCAAEADVPASAAAGDPPLLTLQDTPDVCVREASFPGQRDWLDGTPVFPLCLVASPPKGHVSDTISGVAATAWATANRAALSGLVRRHGALFVRGLLPADAHAFGSLVTDGLALENFPYVGGNAVRTAVVGDVVFTANESPPERVIPFHHELAQTPVSPSWILFFCVHPATVSGGETPLALSTRVYSQLAEAYPAFVQQLAERGVSYRRVMSEYDRSASAIGRGWRATLNVEYPEEAEEALAAKGYTWEWLGNGQPGHGRLLREVSPPLPATRPVGDDGAVAFFNQIYAAYTGWTDEYNTPADCVRDGAGGSLDGEAMAAVGRVLEDCAARIAWTPGDVMYIDNRRAYHARGTFKGSRRVLASLAK